MIPSKPIRTVAFLCMAVMQCCLSITASAQNDIETKLTTLAIHGNEYYLVDSEKALYYFKEYLKLLDEVEKKNIKHPDSITKERSTKNQCIATCYNILGDFDSAQIHYSISLEHAHKLNDTNLILANLTNRAIGYMNYGYQDKALNSYFEIIDLTEKNEKYVQYLAAAYNNIATFYDSRSAVKDFDKALEYRRKALATDIKRNEERDIARDYTNLGDLFNRIKMYDSSQHYLRLAMPIHEKHNNYQGLALTEAIFGDLYEKDSLLDQALLHKQKATGFAQKSGYKMIYVANAVELADFYVKLSQNTSTTERDRYLKHAVQTGTEAFELATETGALFEKYEAAKTLASAYRKLNDYKKAFRYLSLSMAINDTIRSEEAADNAYKIENKFISERNQLLQKDKENTEKLMKSRETTLIIVIIGSILLLAMLVIIYQRMRMVSKQREEIAEQKELILLQKEEVEAQRDFASKQRKEILSSINYAKRLQDAVLPAIPSELSMFVLYLPRDIVSGDFYWYSPHGETLLLAVADCTGHGVPGACMSMLGLSYLREISLLQFNDTPAQMLDTMRQKIITALGQTGIAGETRDGMDLTVCKLNTRTNELQFASAYNPLLVIPSSGEPYTIKGDKQPISYHSNIQPFTNQTIQLQHGDSFYMMSDGLKDLFNPDNKKFTYKRIVNILEELRTAPMQQQHQRLHAEYESWLGNSKQTDDITLMGFRL